MLENKTFINITEGFKIIIFYVFANFYKDECYYLAAKIEKVKYLKRLF